jgi:hypothetical protein
MVSKFHGVFSLLLISVAVVIAIVYLLSHSIGWGLVYLGIIMLANPIVLYSYCAKCLCREDACSHIIPGKLTHLLPIRRQGPYSFWDYFGTAISLVALFGFPQFWLWQSLAIFIFFWILLLAGLFEILLFVCRACSNTNCPNCTLNRIFSIEY